MQNPKPFCRRKDWIFCHISLPGDILDVKSTTKLKSPTKIKLIFVNSWDEIWTLCRNWEAVWRTGGQASYRRSYRRPCKALESKCSFFLQKFWKKIITLFTFEILKAISLPSLQDNILLFYNLCTLVANVLLEIYADLYKVTKFMHVIEFMFDEKRGGSNRYQWLHGIGISYLHALISFQKKGECFKDVALTDFN